MRHVAHSASHLRKILTDGRKRTTSFPAWSCSPNRSFSNYCLIKRAASLQNDSEQKTARSTCHCRTSTRQFQRFPCQCTGMTSSRVSHPFHHVPFPILKRPTNKSTCNKHKKRHPPGSLRSKLLF